MDHHFGVIYIYMYLYVQRNTCVEKNKQASNSEGGILCFEKVAFDEALSNSLQSMISTEPITELDPFLHTPILPPEFADLDP